MDYTKWETVMAVDSLKDFSWTAHQITTSDDYIITQFRIFDSELDTSSEDYLGPVHFQHGSGGDAAGMLAELVWSELVPSLIERGHDVYFGTNRGSQWSLGHATLDYATQPEQYFDFSWHEMAEDVIANTNNMYSISGKKGWYVGYSQGTTQMFVALTKYEAELANTINRAILMAPCTINGSLTAPALTEANMGAVSAVPDQLGIYSYPTLDWETDIDNICTNMAAVICAKFSGTNADDNMRSMKTTDHFLQNQLTQRFQEFVDGWAYPDTYEGTLYDLTSITQIPVSLYAGEEDTTCQYAKAAVTASELPTLQNFVTMKQGTHHFFFDDWKVIHPLLLDELTTEVQSESKEKTVIPYRQRVINYAIGGFGAAAGLVALYFVLS